MAFININNHQFYYESQGSGELILFIHGLGSSTKDWEMQVPYFSNHFEAISIDLRGHGQTKGTDGTYSIVQFASDIAKFIKSKGKKVHVVGISMGGMVAFQLAIDYPALVSSLVIINSFVEVPMDDPVIRKGIRIRKLIPKLIGMRIMGRIIGKKVFPRKDQSKLRKLIADRWADNSVKEYIKAVNAIAGWTVKNELYRINCPVLVIGGEHDYTSIEAKKNYTKLMKKADIVIIPNTGHALPIEVPDILNEIIHNFTKSFLS